MYYFNRFLLLIFCLSLLYLGYDLTLGSKPSPSLPVRKQTAKTSLSKFSQDALENFGEGPLGSKYQRYQKKLALSLYYEGANTRPDQSRALHFFKWENQNYALYDGEPIYFKDLCPEDPDSGDLYFTLSMRGGAPEASLYLGKECVHKEKVLYSRSPSTEMVGEHKLDRNLLVRQKLIWTGQDLFLKKYAKDEYPAASTGERFDFTNAHASYYCFVKEGDLLVFKEGRWVQEEDKTQKWPLMRIESVKDKSIELTIWDVSGKGYESYTISKTMGKTIPKNLAPLKFVGAKTIKRWLVETPLERFGLEEGDLLLHQGNAWKKVQTLGMLESYIEKINQGELFIITKLGYKEGSRELEGELYNASRTDKIAFHLPIEGVDLSKRD